MSRWITKPLFVSSTFLDMQAERDHLHNVVFPELEEWMRQRRMLLEPLDLRWGIETSTVDDTEEKELLVLKVCLDGIAQCQPFLIVLLGDRYGWQPPVERLADVTEEYGYTIKDVEGMSVTALEIDAGLLRSEVQSTRSFVYLRERLPYEDMPEDLRKVYSDTENSKADGAKRLKRLKQRLSKDPRLANRLHQYTLQWDAGRQILTGLETWGQMVLKHLKAEFESDLIAHEVDKDRTWQQEEADELEAFIEHRSRVFVGRQQIIAEIEQLAFGPDAHDQLWAAIYIGEAGAGKSALIAELARRWMNQSDVIVLTHAAGISPQSTFVDRMLRRWTSELAISAGVPDPPKKEADLDSVINGFRNLLGIVAAKRRVVMLIDALNQFNETSWCDQRWVPNGMPNVRLIATAVIGPASERLLESTGVEARTLPVLQPREAREIAIAVCHPYHKTLNHIILDALQSNPGSQNVLWLRMVIDNLLQFDADDFAKAVYLFPDLKDHPDLQIHTYMLNLLQPDDSTTKLNIHPYPNDLVGMYDYLFEELEERYGRPTVRAFSLVIGLSRAGWPERDIASLFPLLGGGIWNPTTGAILRRAFRFHLIRRGSPASWDFFHQHARVAIKARYLSGEGDTQILHAEIGKYLLHMAESQNDPIATREVMHHLLEADSIHDAAAYYMSLRFCNESYFGLNDASPELLSATLSLADLIIKEGNYTSPVRNPGLSKVERMLRETSANPMKWLGLPHNLMFCLCDAIKGKVLGETERSLMTLIHEWFVTHKEVCGDTERFKNAFAVSHSRMGKLELDVGNFEEVRNHYLAALEINKDLHQRTQNTETTRALAVSHSHLSTLEERTGNFEEARMHSLSCHMLLVISHQHMQTTLTARDLSVSHSRLGKLELKAGNFEEAHTQYKAALDIAKDLHQLIQSTETASNLSTRHVDMVEFELKAGNYEEARMHNQVALDIANNLHQIMHNIETAQDLIVSHEWFGDLELKTGNFEKAYNHYKAILDLCEDLHQRIQSAETARDLSVSYKKMGDMELKAGNFDQARKFNQACHMLLKDLHQLMQNADTVHDLSVSHERLGNLEIRAGNFEEARNHEQIALYLRKDFHQLMQNAESARDLSVSHERLGYLELSVGNFEEARKHFETALDLRKDLHQLMKNAETARGLYFIQVNIGDLELKTGNFKEAYTQYQSALDIAKDLHQLIQNAETARDLGNSNVKMGLFFRTSDNHAKSLEYFEIAHSLFERSFNQTGSYEDAEHLIDTCKNVIISLIDLNRQDEAAQYAKQAKELLDTFTKKGIPLNESLHKLYHNLVEELSSPKANLSDEVSLHKVLQEAEERYQQEPTDKNLLGIAKRYYDLAHHHNQAGNYLIEHQYLNKCYITLRTLVSRNVELPEYLQNIFEQLMSAFNKIAIKSPTISELKQQLAYSLEVMNQKPTLDRVIAVAVANFHLMCYHEQMGNKQNMFHYADQTHAILYALVQSGITLPLGLQSLYEDLHSLIIEKHPDEDDETISEPIEE